LYGGKEDGMAYDILETHTGVPVKAWVRGVPFDAAAQKQLRHVAGLPFIHGWVAAMPDVHVGKGATIGSVIPTRGAVIPAAVGVDIGCGMMAVETSLTAAQLPDDLKGLRTAIEAAVPHGRDSWSRVPSEVQTLWARLAPGFSRVMETYPALAKGRHEAQLGTLGGGNHFIEMCLDECDRVWIMLHSGSRGVGNKIGTYFINLAKDDMRVHQVNLPDADLAYFEEGTRYFDAYMTAVGWAQEYARLNREAMMAQVLAALRGTGLLPRFGHGATAVNCPHNYVRQEVHAGTEVWITRKGAVRAGAGELGIIPGSMGAASYIVRGLGNPDSFHSCSHGAGRAMSRTQAKKQFTVADHRAATAHVECRKDAGVVDETPGAYKDIDAVMAAQEDLVSVVHRLRQVVCVKG